MNGKLGKLLQDYGDAEFRCGEFDIDAPDIDGQPTTDEQYDNLLNNSNSAKYKVIEYIKENYEHK